MNNFAGRRTDIFCFAFERQFRYFTYRATFAKKSFLSDKHTPLTASLFTILSIQYLFTWPRRSCHNFSSALNVQFASILFPCIFSSNTIKHLFDVHTPVESKFFVREGTYKTLSITPSSHWWLDKNLALTLYFRARFIAEVNILLHEAAQIRFSMAANMAKRTAI